MSEEFIPITFNKIMQSQMYTVFILGTEEKRFAIYTSPHVGGQIQLHLMNKKKPRPYTHDLMCDIFKTLKIKLLQVVIWDVQDTIYCARLFLEQVEANKKTIIEIDGRPSDCLSLALENNLPIFCKKDVFEKVIPVE